MSNNVIRYDGFYRGKVLKHLDKGLLKVFIYGVYPQSLEAKADSLPTCEQAAPLFAGTNDGNGMFSYPNIGSTVWCFFQNGDYNFPVAFASTLGGGQAFSEYKIARPKVTEKDVENGTDAYVHKINVKKSNITIWESGRIEIVTFEDDSQTNNSKIELDGKGNVKISSTTQVQIVSPVIKLDASSKIEFVTPNQTSVNAVSNVVHSPSILLDANSGDKPSGKVALYGKRHQQTIN